jgi:hypothetical protein
MNTVETAGIRTQRKRLMVRLCCVSKVGLTTSSCGESASSAIFKSFRRCYGTSYPEPAIENGSNSRNGSRCSCIKSASCGSHVLLLEPSMKLDVQNNNSSVYLLYSFSLLAKSYHSTELDCFERPEEREDDPMRGLLNIGNTLSLRV